jgi:hypothetical protein
LVPVAASLLPTPPGLLALRDLRPGIDSLRREHRSDRRTLNNELMALYPSPHVSPWAGLPRVLLLQIAPWAALRRDGRVAQLADRRARGETLN